MERQRGGLSGSRLALRMLVASGTIALAIFFSRAPEREAAPAPPPIVAVAPPATLAEEPALAAEAVPTATASLPPSEPAQEAPWQATSAARPLPEVAVRQPGPARSSQDPAVPAVPVIDVERQPLGGNATLPVRQASTPPAPADTAGSEPPAAQVTHPRHDKALRQHEQGKSGRMKF